MRCSEGRAQLAWRPVEYSKMYWTFVGGPRYRDSCWRAAVGGLGCRRRQVLSSKWMLFFAAKLDREARYLAPSALGERFDVGARAS